MVDTLSGIDNILGFEGLPLASTLIKSVNDALDDIDEHGHEILARSSNPRFRGTIENIIFNNGEVELVLDKAESIIQAAYDDGTIHDRSDDAIGCLADAMQGLSYTIYQLVGFKEDLGKATTRVERKDSDGLYSSVVDHIVKCRRALSIIDECRDQLRQYQ